MGKNESLEDYLRNIVKQPKVLSRLQQQAKKAGADKLSIEKINAKIAIVRTQSIHKFKQNLLRHISG